MNSKWCCGDGGGFPGSPIWVQATFDEPVELSHFTISSGNDTPVRDPRVWKILGSNDGTNFDVIFRQDDPTASVWGDTRNQVLQWTAGLHFDRPNAYTTIRFSCTATGTGSGARYQLNEIELFGEVGAISDDFRITSVVFDPETSIATVTWNSQPGHLYGLDISNDMTLSEGEFEGWSEEVDDKDSDGDVSSYDLPYDPHRSGFLSAFATSPARPTTRLDAWRPREFPL